MEDLSYLCRHYEKLLLNASWQLTKFSMNGKAQRIVSVQMLVMTEHKL